MCAFEQTKIARALDRLVRQCYTNQASVMTQIQTWPNDLLAAIHTTLAVHEEVLVELWVVARLGCWVTTIPHAVQMTRPATESTYKRNI